MEKQKLQLQFRMVHIATEQFAIIETSYQGADTKVEFTANLKFGKSIEQRILVVGMNFSFTNNDIPFLVIEVACHFQLSQESWNACTANEDDTYTIPQMFITQLAMQTVGTTRGVLHCKTEGTPFNQFILPSINLLDLITSDFNV